ncbi:MAG: hypothetical protein QM638_23160 [Nocardioides sp.]|uniref:DUF6752 domain-containing protein n=1 Tax=Nocardioides sp. TaxID=35761 RepID=UPI0039E4D283
MSLTDIARRARDRYERRPGSLRERVAALEAEVTEQRQLNRRIAELTDVVTELLIPIELSDRARIEEQLQRYRRRI